VHCLIRTGTALPPEGSQSSSPEEADAIRHLVAEILNAKTTWIDREDNEAAIGLRDILIIAPYNAQVFELQDRIHGGRIGTVDKFQGQGAPIVIYSVTTSSYLDAPRGMEFLDEKDVEEIEAHRSKTRQAAPDSSEGNLHRWRP
jgi:superfamily I DNA and/or RNA helicase